MATIPRAYAYDANVDPRSGETGDDRRGVVRADHGERRAPALTVRPQINIGLGRGSALDIFNDNITGYEEIPR